jgi:methyltransferase (TIGR00027 family)
MVVPAVRNISDTALWAARYRARETERGNGLFRDPFARRLAGERGEQVAASFPGHDRNEWAWILRTVLFDGFIAERVAQGADMVVNLAAGLDARPYRMDLPAGLPWIEVDLPDLLTYKEQVLAGERPVCSLERVRLDLSDTAARRDLFAKLGQRAKNALVVTEGLLIYLKESEVGTLAEDLAAQPGFRHWVVDIASPGLLQMLQREIGSPLAEAGAPLQFAPEAGPGFFTAHGWKAIAVRSPLKAAARAKRLPFWLRLAALLPESNGRQGRRHWSGVCLLERQET